MVEVVAFPLCPLIDRRTPSMCHIPLHLHRPSSLSAQLSLLRLLTPLFFILVLFFSPSPPSSSRLAPLLATIALSSQECQHPRDSTDHSLSEAHVCCLFIVFPVYLYIQDIPYSLFLIIPFPSSCLVVLAVPLFSASLQ